MHYQFDVDVNGIERSFAWLSLLSDKSISVGMRDRTFVAESFRAEHFVWNWNNRVKLEYRVPRAPVAQVPVENPHLTFHPSLLFHFRPNGGPDQFEAIADVGLVTGVGETVEWARFVSKPIGQLPEAGPPRDSARTVVEVVAPSRLDCSIGLGVDFVPMSQGPVTGKLLSRCHDWGEVRIHVFCEELPEQEATLSWFHEY